MSEFTPTQGRYLAFIHAYTEGFGLPPAETEIAEAIGVAPPSVNQMMKTLEKKALIRREPGVPRSIKILVPTHAIPEWQGKPITRTVRTWTIGKRAPRLVRTVASRTVASRTVSSRTVGSREVSSHSVRIYRFKITLRGYRPAIWRCIETPDATLEKLHELIQTAMGWTNSHLHQFEIAGAHYTDPRAADGFDDLGAVDYTGVRIGDLVSQHGEKLRMRYEYDFGDGWEHDVVLEKVIESEPGIKYPRCVDGERACPPEDIGGVHGFAEYVEAITDPSHSEHEDYLEWNGPFDPASFDAARATRLMKKGLPTW